MLDLVGPELGLLDTELAKLVLFLEKGQPIKADLVRDIVGGWRTKSVWDLMDAAADGRAGEAIAELDKLLAMGEVPQALVRPDRLVAAPLRRCDEHSRPRRTNGPPDQSHAIAGNGGREISKLATSINNFIKSASIAHGDCTTGCSRPIWRSRAHIRTPIAGGSCWKS